MRKLTYAQAVKEATDQMMEIHDNVILIGEGVPDGVFETTSGLKSKYPDRVFDSPLSENAVTGICIGAAISGLRPIIVHQRADFSLLAMDQIVNNAAKWRYTFGQAVPFVMRLIVGRGWGQGPQHSQSLQGLFAAIPGLKVVMPSSAYDAKGIMISAIEDNDPVIILEHRWLHNIAMNVPEKIYRVPLDKSFVINKGSDITIVTLSYMTIEALRVCRLLEWQGISVEVIDAISVAPIDIDAIVNSVKKTGRLIIADTAHKTGSIAGEIIRQVMDHAFFSLKKPPVVLALKDYPQPTSHYLTSDYYPTKHDILNTCLDMMGKRKVEIPTMKTHDSCTEQYNGAF